jgi:glycosyltransferase involved in cell wall biosynthesis
VASTIAEGLLQKGVDVTLFATGDSITRGRLLSVCKRPLGEEAGDAKVWESLHIAQLMERAADYDLIHSHYDFLPLTYSRLIRTPMLTTIHGLSNESIVPVYQKYNRNTHYVSISNSDRHPALSYIDTVYNGIDESQFRFEEKPGDYLLSFGRIHPDKGTHLAIEIATRLNRKLVICGLVQDETYFREKVAPLVNGSSVVYEGNVGPEQRSRILGNAAALLHPISFEEPFGLSVAEAMMCGTPVIAFSRGSMPELIVHGVTGFLVHSVEEAITAVNQLSSINRLACRKHAMRHFSKEMMVAHYLKVYQKILEQPKQQPALWVAEQSFQ